MARTLRRLDEVLNDLELALPTLSATPSPS